MAIGVDCSCGHALRSKDAYQRKLLRCPTCGRIWRLPSAPGTILPHSAVEELLCQRCGKGFSSKPHLAPVKLSTGQLKLCHRSCSQEGQHKPRFEQADREHETVPLAVGVDCECGTSIRFDQQHGGKLARCDRCGKVYRLPTAPGEILPPDATQEVCCVCGGSFSAEPDYSVSRLRDGRLCHPACQVIACCTNQECGRKFHVKGRLPAKPPKIFCPECKASVVLRLVKGAGEAPAKNTKPHTSPAAASGFSSFLDEELQPEPGERLRSLCRLEDGGTSLTCAQLEEKRLLIFECLSANPRRCPYCDGDIEVGAVLCTACGLHFERGTQMTTLVGTAIEPEEDEVEAESSSGGVGDRIAGEVAGMIIEGLLGF